MQKTEQKSSIGMAFIKILFIMYAITMLLLVLLAFVLFKTDISELVYKVWLIAVYIISGFAGGFLIGRRAKSQKFLWGFFIGICYFGILFVVSVALQKGLEGDVTHLLTTMIMCTAAGTVGGMVS